MASRYTPTPLPAKLDISKSDTAQQLRSNQGVAVSPSSQRISKDAQLQDEMNRMCIEVVTNNLKQYLDSHIAGGVHPNSTDAFEGWMRSFHSEYEDSWYMKNHTRLVKSFRPIWDGYFGVASTQAEAALGSVGVGVVDLLELGSAGPRDPAPPLTTSSPLLPDLLG